MGSYWLFGSRTVTNVRPRVRRVTHTATGRMRLPDGNIVNISAKSDSRNYLKDEFYIESSIAHISDHSQNINRGTSVIAATGIG